MTVTRVSGEPKDARTKLNELAQSQQNLDVIAGTAISANWLMFSDLADDFPIFSGVPLVYPSPYTWPTFLRRQPDECRESDRRDCDHRCWHDVCDHCRRHRFVGGKPHCARVRDCRGPNPRLRWRHRGGCLDADRSVIGRDRRLRRRGCLFGRNGHQRWHSSVYRHVGHDDGCQRRRFSAGGRQFDSRASQRLHVAGSRRGPFSNSQRRCVNGSDVFGCGTCCCPKPC